MGTTMQKTWTVQVSGLKEGVRLSSRKTMPMQETIPTMRTWAVTKVSMYKAILPWTKTIWAVARSMKEMRQSTRRSARRSMRVRMRWNTRMRTRQEINELITIWVSSIIKVSLLNSLTPEAKLIQLTSTARKHANKTFLSQLGGFFPHFSLGVKGRLWIEWVVSFGGFDYFLLLVIVGTRDKLRSTLVTLVLTPLKAKTQFVCGFGCTLLSPTQVILNQFLTHHSPFKARSQISNMPLQLGILFGTMEKVTLEKTTHLAWRG
jgi:hypothetical protein